MRVERIETTPVVQHRATLEKGDRIHLENLTARVEVKKMALRQRLRMAWFVLLGRDFSWSRLTLDWEAP